jgi:hypothetical protein
MALSPVTSAVLSVKAGLSARAGLAAARAAGLSIRDATWFRIVSEVRRSLADQIDEASRPQNRRPLADEISTLTTKAATGFIQYADVFVRDRDTGIVSIRHYAVRGNQLQARGSITKKALARFEQETTPEGNYSRETILGAAYTATYQMIPGL